MTYYSSPKSNSWQKQIIMGTILGGSSIVKPAKGRNCYLFMRSCKQDWVKYKAEELKSLASEHPFTQEGNTLRWHSNCYPVFNEFRDEFYKGDKKKLTMNILDKLMDIGLAVWYGDRGKLIRNKLVLNTGAFGEDGTNLAIKYFNEVGIECNLYKERNKFRVQFTKEGTLKYFATIAHTLPEFMCSELQLIS